MGAAGCGHRGSSGGYWFCRRQTIFTKKHHHPLLVVVVIKNGKLVRSEQQQSQNFPIIFEMCQMVVHVQTTILKIENIVLQKPPEMFNI